MKKHVSLVVGLLALPWIAWSQVSLSGKVYDATNQNSLTGAHIVLGNTFNAVTSSKDGSFRISGLKPGTYQLKVSYMGYETFGESIDIRENKQLDINLQPSLTLADEVVVMATRADKNTPATYTNIGREQLNSKNLGQDIPVLLSLSPSVVISSDAGAGIGYTWMNIRGSDPSRINITLNGIPVNDAESHNVWWVNMPDVAGSIQNMQIQRGVGTSTNGAAAFGASVNMQTTVLNAEPYAEINSSAGSFNTLKNSVSFGTGKIKSGWAIDGRASLISSDGYVDRASSSLKSYYLSAGWYGSKTNLKLINMSGTEKTYQAWDGVPSDSLETNRTFNPTGMYVDEAGNVKYYDNETDNYQQDHYQLHFSHLLNPNMVINAAAHYTYGRGYYEQYKENQKFKDYELSPISLGDTMINKSDLIRRKYLKNHYYGTTASLNYDNRSNLKTNLGGSFHIYDGLHFGEVIWARYAGNSEINHRYYENTGYKVDYNYYLKVNYSPLERLHLFADLQMRHIIYEFEGPAFVNDELKILDQTSYFNFFNPKGGFIFEISPMQKLYTYVGVGNREPVRDDFTESSPESRPGREKMINYEAGYQFAGSHARASVNFYFMDYYDQLVLTGEINDVGGYTRTNTPRSYRAGIEMEAGFIITPKIQWNGNLSLSRNKIKEFTEYSDVYDANYDWIGSEANTYKNTNISFSPSIIAASQFVFAPIKQLHIELMSKYVGRQYIDNTSNKDRSLNPYFLNDIKLGYNFSLPFAKSIEISVLINNILDEEYISNGWIYKAKVENQSGFMVMDDGYFPQAGRHFLTGIRFRF